MAIVKSEAFAIRKIPFRETSWLVTLFTRDAGKIKGISKGVRKIKSKLLSAFEPLTYLNVVFYERVKSNLHLISDASVLDHHDKIRKSFSSLTYASYFAELIDELVDEHDPQPAVFELLTSVIHELEKPGPAYDVLARAFEYKLLELVGLSPAFENCQKCGTAELQKIYFSVAHGGIYCEKCHAQSGGFLISKGTLAAVDSLLHIEMKDISDLEFNPQISQELHQITRRFIERRIEKRLKSLQFMDEARKNSSVTSLI